MKIDKKLINELREFDQTSQMKRRCKIEKVIYYSFVIMMTMIAIFSIYNVLFIDFKAGLFGLGLFFLFPILTVNTVPRNIEKFHTYIEISKANQREQNQALIEFLISNFKKTYVVINEGETDDYNWVQLKFHDSSWANTYIIVLIATDTQIRFQMYLKGRNGYLNGIAKYKDLIFTELYALK